jgi:adenylylsulfate kinase-like enzyme
MLVVITGPIASGKSTLAREVARQLGEGGVRAAVIDLDLVHDMLVAGRSETGGDASWALARRASAALADAFLADGVAVVIADGSFNAAGDREVFARNLDPGVEPRFVTLRITYEEALRRAQGDPARGRSRDPAFLGPYFAAVEPTLEEAPASDIVIDTERTSARSAAAAIVRHVGQQLPKTD